MHTPVDYTKSSSIIHRLGHKKGFIGGDIIHLVRVSHVMAHIIGKRYETSKPSIPERGKYEHRKPITVR